MIAGVLVGLGTEKQDLKPTPDSSLIPPIVVKAQCNNGRHRDSRSKTFPPRLSQLCYLQHLPATMTQLSEVHNSRLFLH